MSGGRHVMLDLETLGVGPMAAILTIGWCVFDPWDDTGEVPTPRKLQVDVGSCVKAGMIIHDSTFRWWTAQDTAARDQLRSSASMLLPDALELFAKVFNGAEYVWGNGANFDNAILETAYDLCNMPIPWRFFNSRCFRTLKNLAPAVPTIEPLIPHCAASDAQAQAIQTQLIFKHLGI